MIVVLDYGMGNVGSILNMLKKIGQKGVASADARLIEAADGIILPGVGAFDEGMERLERLDLVPLLNRQALELRKPILGICLGMQLLTRRSDEGRKPGLSWVDAETVRFFRNHERAPQRVPHMGWNTVTASSAHALFDGIEDPRYYFVHSYHVECKNPDNVLATADYGGRFTAALMRDNILGTQFHPEKSHSFGLRLIENFVKRVCHVQIPSYSLPAA